MKKYYAVIDLDCWWKYFCGNEDITTEILTATHKNSGAMIFLRQRKRSQTDQCSSMYMHSLYTVLFLLFLHEALLW